SKDMGFRIARYGEISTGQVEQPKSTTIGQVEKTKKEKTTGIVPDMVFFKKDTFIRGNDDNPYLKPAHKVVLDDFYFAKDKVTQDLYEKIMGNNPSVNKDLKAPVDNYTLEEAYEFCRRISLQSPLLRNEIKEQIKNMTPMQYRIFTEEHRENGLYGIQAASEAAYVAQKLAKIPIGRVNEYGINNILGNKSIIGELCHDLTNSRVTNTGFDNIDPKKVLINPFGPKNGKFSILKFYFQGDDGKKALYDNGDWQGTSPIESKKTFGFRIVMRVQSGEGVGLAPTEPLKQEKVEVVEVKKTNPFEGLELVYLPGGEFMMGGSKVSVDDFYVATTLVRRELFDRVMRIKKSEEKNKKAPVTGLTRDAAFEFCRRLSLSDKNLGIRMKLKIIKMNPTQYRKFVENNRLPGLYGVISEAEWEYMILQRKKQFIAKHFEDLDRNGNRHLGSSNNYIPEYCHDWNSKSSYGRDFFSTSSSKDQSSIKNNPFGPETGDMIVSRSGYNLYDRNVTVTSEARFLQNGFRIVMRVPSEKGVGLAPTEPLEQEKVVEKTEKVKMAKTEVEDASIVWKKKIQTDAKGISIAENNILYLGMSGYFYAFDGDKKKLAEKFILT
ncbi:MAG: hypothetical protein KKA19_00545, partial [Candidatus Margulisbacteria bacterium]|nr:hypothetical protein [Candidatus Margulisiibacteriota bacterium]